MKHFLYSLLVVLLFGVSTLQAQDYKTHKIKQGETVTTIAKQYSLTLSEIYALNPDAKKGVHPNMVLILPSSVAASQSEATPKNQIIKFKEHKTKKRETLFGISKKHQITVEDLKKHNTFLYANPLLKGAILKIPVYGIPKGQVVEQAKKTKSYSVKPKEGKWRVAYKFGITVKELEALNPNMGEFLNEGEIVQVPATDVEKTIDETYDYYNVLPAEGFYRLKVKLGLTQEQLEELNPELKELGLKEGMVLKIPLKNSLTTVDEKPIKVNLIDSVSNLEKKRIVFMLPFRLDRVPENIIEEEIVSSDDEEEEYKPTAKDYLQKDLRIKTSLDFYTGALTAIEDLKKRGISLQVDVFDTKDDIKEIPKIISQNDFKSVDVVIGPLLTKNFNEASLLLCEDNIPMISPISKKVEVFNNVFQARTPDRILADRMVNYIKTDTTASNIVVISDFKSVKKSDALKKEFADAAFIFPGQDDEGNNVNYIIRDSIVSKIKPGKNIVFLETRDNGFASSVTSILASIEREYQEANEEEELEELEEIIIMLTTTSGDKAFNSEGVNNGHLSKLEYHCVTRARSYDKEAHANFIKNYKNKYKIEPNKIAVRGYDITMDAILRLVSSGNMHQSVQKLIETEYVENKFAYKKNFHSGGYYNTTSYLIKHNNLTIEIVE